MRKHLRGNRGTRLLAVLLAAVLVVGSVDVTALAEASRGMETEEQSLPAVEAEASGDTEGKEDTPTAEEAGADAKQEAEEAAVEAEPQESEEAAAESEPQAVPVKPELQTETIELDPELLAELPDNDELFAGYVQKILYGDNGIATYGTTAGAHLTGLAKDLYDELKPMIKTLAAEGGYIRCSVTSGKYRWEGTDARDQAKAVLKSTLNALVADCPYELYWFDRTKALNWDGTGSSGSVEISGIIFYVTSKYADGNNYTQVAPTKAKAAAAAAANAQAIVEKYKGLPSYMRVQGYNTEINALVKYDGSVDYATDNTPWEIVNVFDKDPATYAQESGYARAFQYLCDLDGGITCYTVSGKMAGARTENIGNATPSSHVWNIVSMNGANYLVDVCNCSETKAGGKGFGYPDTLLLRGMVEKEKGKKYSITFQGKVPVKDTYYKYTMVYEYDDVTMSTFAEDELIMASEDYSTSTITEDMISITRSDVTIYDGKSHNVEIKEGSHILSSANYTLTITKDGTAVTEIKDAGTYTIKVEGQKYYSGSAEKEFTIKKRPLTPKITGTIEKEYDGTTATDGIQFSLEGSCDMVGYVAISRYADAEVGTEKEVTVSVELNSKDAENYELTSDKITVYTGVITQAAPTIKFRSGYATTYTYSGKVVENPSERQLKFDEFISYQDLKFTWYQGTSDSGTLLTGNPKDAGTYYLKVSIAETKNYKAASAGVQVTIKRKPVTDPVITFEGGDTYVFNWSYQEPKVTVKDGETIIPEEEYEVTYRNNGNVGTATAEVSPADGGNYEVSGTKTFTITPFDISDTAVAEVYSGSDVTYTGHPIEPVVIVRINDGSCTRELELGVDYTVIYANNTDVGTAAFTVKGCGNYTGEVSGTFEITVGTFTGTEFYNGLEKDDTVYYNKAVSITAEGMNTEANAVDKYLISDSLDMGSFTASYSFDGETDGAVTKTLYFQSNLTGKVYKKDITVYFDKTAPTGKIKIGTKFWEKLLETITFGHYKVNENVTIEGEDTLSGVSAIEYLISDKQLTAEELKGSGVSYTTYDENAKPSLENDKNQIVYAKITDKAGNAGYLSSDGIILDTTAPTISDIQAVAGADWTDTQFRFQFTVNEEGTYYYQVLSATEAAPTAETVMAAATAAKEGENAGTGATGALTDGSVTITRTATGLRANTAYKIYVVAQDKVYNISTNAADPNTSEVASGTVTTRKAAPVVAENPTVSGVYGTKVSELKIDGGKVTADGVAIAGTWAMAGAESNELDKILSVSTTETCTLIFTPEDTDYPAREVKVTPTITARPVTVTIHPVSREYREKDPEFTYTVATGEGLLGLVGNDDPGIILTTEANVNSEVGAYDITGNASNQNYDVTITGGKNALTIVQAELEAVTVSVKDDKKLTYGEKLGTLTLQGTFAAKKSGATVEEGTFTVKNADVQPNAGTAEIEWIFTPADEKNYKPVNGTANITVEKATPESAAAPTAAGLTYGQTLAESMLTDGKAVNLNTQDTVAGTWSWADDTVKPTVDNQGYRVVFTPADTANYNSIEVTVGVTVKKAVPTISEAPTASDLTYGQTLSDSTLTGGAASTDGTFIWAKTEIRPEVKDSETTGYDVVFTPKDTVNWENGEAKVQLKVNPKTLTWDGSALTVLTKLADETKDASLIGEMKVSGMLDGDDAGLSYEELTAEFDTAEAGTDKQVTVTIVGAVLKNENYQLPAETTCMLKGSIEKTTVLPGQAGLGEDYRLVVSEKDVAEVTPALAKIEDLNTPDKIVEYLKKLLLERKTAGKTPVKGNTVVYDAVLLYSADGGVTWTRATADNFPAEGVKVVLPYPEGTNASNYRFSAVHMFTTNCGAYQAGDVETPKVTLTKEGITMTLKSLSPIALSWVKVKKASGSGNHGGSSSSGSTVTSAATGDSSRPVFWGTLALLGLLGISALLTAVRRRRGQR